MRNFTGYQKKFVQLTRRFGPNFDAIPPDAFDDDEGELDDDEETEEEQDTLDGVLFGYYGSEESFEVSMTWYKYAPTIGVLEADSGSWSVLAANPELIQRLANADDQGVQADEFCAMLQACGFADASHDDELME